MTRRTWDTGLVRPYRPAPADFRETYLRMGWDGIEDHYRTNYRCISRWIEQCGGDELRQARAAITGSTLRPHRRSFGKAYARSPIGQTVMGVPLVDAVERGKAEARQTAVAGLEREKVSSAINIEGDC